MIEGIWQFSGRRGRISHQCQARNSLVTSFFPQPGGGFPQSSSIFHTGSTEFLILLVNSN
jgi:hypothetical protein